MEWSRNKLTEGVCYPLKRSQLESAFTQSNIMNVHRVHFSWDKRPPRHDSPEEIILAAWYSGEVNRGVWAKGTGSINITLFAVEASHSQVIRKMLLEQGVPALCQWLNQAETAGNVWRAMDHSFYCHFVDEELRIRHT